MLTAKKVLGKLQLPTRRSELTRCRCLFLKPQTNFELMAFYFIRYYFTFVDNRVEYQCSECDRRFLTKQACKQHQSLHGDSAAKCEECDKRFVNTAVLKQHIDRIHKGKSANLLSVVAIHHYSVTFFSAS